MGVNPPEVSGIRGWRLPQGVLPAYPFRWPTILYTCFLRGHELCQKGSR
jgi:hypothetical protein